MDRTVGLYNSTSAVRVDESYPWIVQLNLRRWLNGAALLAVTDTLFFAVLSCPLMHLARITNFTQEIGS